MTAASAAAQVEALRDRLAALDSDTGWTQVTLQPGWSGAAYMRRTGTKVRVIFNGINTTNASPPAVLLVPFGYLADTPPGVSERFLLHNTSSAGRRGWVSFDQLSIANYTSGEALYGSAEWITRDPTPS